MDVLVLIDRLEELVEDARSFPGFGNTAMVDRLYVPRSIRDNPGAYRTLYAASPRYFGGK